MFKRFRLAIPCILISIFRIWNLQNYKRKMHSCTVFIVCIFQSDCHTVTSQYLFLLVALSFIICATKIFLKRSIKRPLSSVYSVWRKCIFLRKHGGGGTKMPPPLTGRRSRLLKVWRISSRGGAWDVFIYTGDSASPGLRADRLLLLSSAWLSVRSQESGVRCQESGVRSQESGVRSQESGVFSCVVMA